jgi:hypothetical protein
MNSAGAMAGLAATWITGYLLVRGFLGRRGWVGASLGWLLGSGLTSLAVFLVFLCGGRLLPWLPIIQALLLAGAWTFGRTRLAIQEAPIPDTPPGHFWRPGAWLMISVLAVLFASTGLSSITNPVLRFDELHNWAFKALSTAVHGQPFQDEWPFMLFPNHIPFLTASFLGYQGEPRETVAHLIPLLFLFSAVGVMAGAARQLSGKSWWGLPMAVLLLFGVPELIYQTDRFYCDMPLAALHLASVLTGLIWLADGPLAAAVLSGVFAGLGVWTKTEGLLLAAGVGGGLFLGALLRPRDERKPFVRALLFWIAGFLLVAFPWPLYLKFRGVDLQSSGHLGNAFYLERWGRLFAYTWMLMKEQFRMPVLAFFLFLALGFSRRTRASYIFLLATLAVGLLHLWLPILVLPEDAFGGWRLFMKHGMDRYILHIAPVMLLSLAAVGRAGRLKGLDALFRRLSGGHPDRA